MRQVLTLFMILLISILTASLFAHSFLSNTSVDPPQIHIGVAFCGNTTAEAKLLIDRVKTYTNLFVLQSGPIVESENATNEILDYAVENGLDINSLLRLVQPRLSMAHTMAGLRRTALGQPIAWRVFERRNRWD